MNEYLRDNGPLSPVQQLENLYDSLADDVFDAPLDVDEETKDRGSRIVRVAMDQALGLSKSSQPGPKPAPQQPPAPKADTPSTSSSFSSWPRSRDFGWFARRFGLHPVTAGALTIIALAFNAFAWGSLGVGTLLEIPLLPLVGFLALILQKRLYQDDNGTALLKGLAAMALTAIPIPIAPFVFVPAGIVGLVWGKSRKRTSETQPK